MDLAGKRVLVMGLGASGRAAAALAASRGAQVVGVDTREGLAPIEGVELALGPHDRARFLAAELIIVSPGVPPTQPDLAAAEAAGVPVMGELAFAWSFLGAGRAAGVTGTNGKSTVTWFTGQLLASAGVSAFVGGNLGRPLADAVLVGDTGVAQVIEASSYQLERVGDFHPVVAVLLNLTPDHLARHGTMEAYAAAKCRIFEHQGPDDWAVWPADDPLVDRLASAAGGARPMRLGREVRREGKIGYIELPEGLLRLDLGVVRVPGAHNLDNALVAAVCALKLGASAEAVQRGLGELRALAHRMEVVAEREGVTWINDSKATNVAATEVGLAGLDRPAVVLLGGQAKGEPFAPLVPKLRDQRAVICFGGDGPRVADELEALGVRCHRVGPLAEAVALAATRAKPGDLVLLSPGCASFDEFENFEHRGRVFAALAQGGPR